MDLSLQTVSLVGTLGLCAYLTARCAVNPNPNPTSSTAEDTIALLTDVGQTGPYVACIVWFFHSMIVLFPEHRSSFCPNSDALNQDLFTWSKHSTAFILTILIAAPIRLLSYATLGKNFTFRLDKPKEIIKTGIYAYVQHPSYTTLGLLQMASFCYWLRLDGFAACYLPTWMIRTNGLVQITEFVAVSAMLSTLWIRIMDEEAMLKKEFGKEWIEYHSKTKRFIPYVI